MLKRYHQLIGGTFRFVDACVIGAAWLLAYALRFSVPLIEVTKGFPAFATYAALLPLVMFLWMIVFSGMGVYRPHGILRRTEEAWLLGRSHAVALLVLIAMTYLFSEYRYSRVVMGFFGVLGALGVIGTRLLLRNILRAIRQRGFQQSGLMLVGESAALEVLIPRIKKFPELGFKIQGIIAPSGGINREIAGVSVVGELSDLPRLLKSYQPESLVIALSREQAPALERILSQVKDETIDLHLIPDIYEYVILGCAVEDFNGLPILNLNDSPLEGWGAIFKRVTDFVLALLGLLVISPLLLFIALAIKLTSRGPVLYRQERMGLDGRTFGMLKFRSMRVDAEATGVSWTQANDPRRTPIGALLRSTSIDELPQLWNVLRGEMSLVGPRPERPMYVEKFRHDIPHYMLRHKVKAGITGWAQVNGLRGDTSLNARIEHDLYYIRNWSYLLDLKILWLTLWKGFIHRNAY
jgi:Undecaprenyl-phosphate glucose phosphotransferase